MGSDVLTPKQRSYCMSKIRGKNTGPEIILRKALWANGVRYRLNYKIPGKPDIILVKSKIAIFVDGCFWHGCPLHSNLPRTNRKFWKEKILKNKKRDQEINKTLSGIGWLVIRIWEHEIKNNLKSSVDMVLRSIKDRTC
jgi:DNA mismatch endonuclease (patch repair protein)